VAEYQSPDFALLDEISEARMQDFERLGGDVGQLVSSLTMDDVPDSLTPISGLEQVFEMPTISVPGTGSREVASPPGDG
jgi:hypothetical protein